MQHDALQYLADSYDVPLIDFNLPSVQEAAGLDFPFDYWDEKHANVIGAQKMTNYIGAFLKDRCELSDVRGSADYDYLKAQDADYQAVRDGIGLMQCDDLIEYLRLLKNDRFTVFVSAKGDPGSGMSDEARAAFGALGLTGLQTISAEDAYVGVISGGSVLLDEKAEPWERLYADGTLAEDGECTVRDLYRVETDVNGKAKTAVPTLLSGENTFSLESAGFQSGNLCTIKFDGGNRADSRRGVNFIVYDGFLKRIVDRSSFDTCTPEMRRSDHGLDYEYLMRLDVSHMAAASSIAEYLAVSDNSDSCTTILCGTFTEDTDLLSEEDRSVLNECGVGDASLLEKQPCIAVIRGGKLLAWITADPSETIGEEIPDLLNVSVQKKPGGNLTVKIADESFSIAENSLYAIAYNGKLNRVINNRYLRMP